MKHPLRALSLLFALLLPLSLLSCAGALPDPIDDRVICTVNGEDICYDEFRYYFLNCKKELDGGDNSVWEGNEELKKTFLSRLEYALKRAGAIKAMAKKYELKLEKEDRTVIEAYIAQLRDSVSSDEEYRTELDRQFMTEYSLYRVLETQYLFELVRAYVMDESNFILRADDETLRKELETSFWRGAQILIRNDEGDIPAENKALAEDILEKLESGESSFFKLVGTYGEDPGMRGNENGYYFTKGQLLSYIEDAVRSLEEGEHSGVIENVHGYAIVMRLPMEEDYIKAHFEELRDALMNRQYLELLEESIPGIELQTTPLYYSFDIAEMK